MDKKKLAEKFVDLIRGRFRLDDDMDDGDESYEEVEEIKKSPKVSKDQRKKMAMILIEKKLAKGKKRDMACDYE